MQNFGITKKEKEMVNFKLDKRDAKILCNILVDIRKSMQNNDTKEVGNIAQRINFILLNNEVNNDTERIISQIENINTNKKSVRLRLGDMVVSLLASVILTDAMRTMYDEPNYYMNSDVLVKVLQGAEKYLRK